MRPNATQTQWFEITRKDGKLQYASKTEGGYLLYGSGFLITEFDAVSVTPIDIVPTDLQQGVVYIDDASDGYFKAICNVNDRWNGWAKPFISEDDIEHLCNILSWEEHTYKFDAPTDELGGRVTITSEDGSEHIHSTEMFGENWYYLGNEGLVFEFIRQQFNNYGNPMGYHTPSRSVETYFKLKETFGDQEIFDNSWHNDIVDTISVRVLKTAEGFATCEFVIDISIPNADVTNFDEEEIATYCLTVRDMASEDSIYTKEFETIEKLLWVMEDIVEGFKNVDGIVEAQLHLLYGAVLGEFGATSGDDLANSDLFDEAFVTVLKLAVRHALYNIE